METFCPIESNSAWPVWATKARFPFPWACEPTANAVARSSARTSKRAGRRRNGDAKNGLRGPRWAGRKKVAIAEIGQGD
jgi:hypothetical protein